MLFNREDFFERKAEMETIQNHEAPEWVGEEKMSESTQVRWGWLRFMYIYTIVGAGGFGLGMILVPEIMQSAFRFPKQDPVIFGIAGSVYTAFGLISFFGLRSPLKFVPVLLLQLCYKVIWLIGIILPLILTGRFPLYATTLLVIFATYIIGDFIAIPFSYVFPKRTNAP
jgi:hypothetical protein